MDNNDEYVEWRTKIDASDAPPGKRLDGSEQFHEYYNRLTVANTLDWNGKWVDQNRVTKKAESGILDSVSSRLELTDYQRDKACRYYKSLPDNFLNAYPMTLLIICVCGISGKEDGREYHPEYVRNGKQNEFVALVSSLGFSYRELYSCWNRIKVVIDNG